MFLMNVDAGGEIQWATDHRRTETMRNQFHRRIIDNAGNLYVTARSEGKATVTKTNVEGVEAWQRFWEGSGDSGANAIAVDALGNVYVLGHFSKNFFVGSKELQTIGECATFINKLDSNGNVLWSTQLTGSGKVIGYGIAADHSNNIVVTGAFEGTFAYGSELIQSAGGQDVFVVKLDEDGNVKWGMAAGGVGQDYGNSVAVHGSGDTYVTGAFTDTASFGNTVLQSRGGLDVFWMKLSNS